jgi:hypothetical protein
LCQKKPGTKTITYINAPAVGVSKNMKKCIVFALLLPPFAEASWMEFCHLSGEVISDVNGYEQGKSFDFRVDEAEKFSVTRGELYFSSYTDCQRHVGKVYEVRYSNKEYVEAKQPKRGQTHCASYTLKTVAPECESIGCRAVTVAKN